MKMLRSMGEQKLSSALMVVFVTVILVLGMIQFVVPMVSAVSGDTSIVIGTTGTEDATMEMNSRKICCLSNGSLVAVYLKVFNTKRNVFVGMSIDNGSTWVEKAMVTSQGSYSVSGVALVVDKMDHLHVLYGLGLGVPHIQCTIMYQLMAGRRGRLVLISRKLGGNILAIIRPRWLTIIMICMWCGRESTLEAAVIMSSDIANIQTRRALGAQR